MDALIEIFIQGVQPKFDSHIALFLVDGIKHTDSIATSRTRISV